MVLTKALFYGKIFMEDKILPGRRAGSGSMAPGCPVSPEKARLHNERRGTHLIFRKGEKNMTMKETLRKKAKGKKGFTLVELVIVIAVLAIIAAIAIPTVTNVINNANQSADASNAQSIELAIKTAQSECAAYNTNKSEKVETMGLANGETITANATVTLTKLLSAYGVDAAVISKPKVANDKFYYDTATGKVVASNATDGTKPTGTVLSGNQNFEVAANGTLTIIDNS